MASDFKKGFKEMTEFVKCFLNYMRQCGPVVRAIALRSGDHGFKKRPDHWLNYLFLAVPGSTS